jgi:hypothetical protein
MFSFDYQKPDPLDAPHLELRRIAEQRGINLSADYHAAKSTLSLITGEAPLCLDEISKIRTLATLLRCEPAYIVSLQTAHMKATGQAPKPAKCRRGPSGKYA